jgi:pimeloyl-ACP methyl ester carboxylesterase
MTAAPELLAIPMVATSSIDIYSGVARRAGKLWAGRRRASPALGRTAVAFLHPSSNFIGHYMLEPLSRRGVDAIGINTRYLANDSALIMENCVLDVGSVVRFLRSEGYERVVLVGNSGGGGLAALYQSQAESADIRSTPAGDPPDLTEADLPPVDGLIEFMAHPGRALTLTDWLDPAIIDETDPFWRDRSLDMFEAGNGPPYSTEFISRYREGQLQRNRRITSWVKGRLAFLERSTGEAVRDLPFVVHGTCADPRFLDLSLDPSDREVGSLWGPAQAANFSPATLGHLTSLRSWLSQWSIDDTNCDGVRHLSRISVPALVMYGTADQSCPPAESRRLFDAVTHPRKDLVEIRGGHHYFDGQPDLIEEAADRLVTWLEKEDLK